jgi:hypothetical protein
VHRAKKLELEIGNKLKRPLVNEIKLCRSEIFVARGGNPGKRSENNTCLAVQGTGAGNGMKVYNVIIK